MNRVQEADVIGMASHVRKELADGNAAGTCRMKRPGGLEKFLCFSELNPGLGEGEVFSMIALQASARAYGMRHFSTYDDIGNEADQLVRAIKITGASYFFFHAAVV